MRIRSVLAGFAIGVGALVLSSPGAFADTGAQPTTAPTASTSKPAQEAAPAVTRTAAPRESAPSATIVRQRPQVVKPVGAAETGAGMQDASSSTGMFVIGGVGLVALAGGGTLAARRLRKQS
ncbi:MAG: hypothetical protein ABW224_04595 [Kibdelosporangium sp.]